MTLKKLNKNILISIFILTFNKHVVSNYNENIQFLFWLFVMFFVIKYTITPMYTKNFFLQNCKNV